MKYKKKPVVIEAVQLNASEESITEVLEFIGKKKVDYFTPDGLMFSDYCKLIIAEGLKIPTLEGEMTASIGDYIIKGVHGEFYPCKPDIFEETYEKVEL